MKSDSIFLSGNTLKIAIMAGRIDVADLYATLTNDMLGFLEKFIWLCQRISNILLTQINRLKVI